MLSSATSNVHFLDADEVAAEIGGERTADLSGEDASLKDRIGEGRKRLKDLLEEDK